MTDENDKLGLARTDQLAPRESLGGGMSPRTVTVAGYLWSVAGGLTSGILGVFCSFCVGYGCCLLAGARGRRHALLGGLCALAAGLLVTLASGDGTVVEAVAYVAVGLAMGMAYGLGRANSGLACLVAVASACALIAGDAAVLALQGTTVTAYMDEVLSVVQSGLSSATSGSLDQTAAAQTVLQALRLLWPSGYTILAFTACACAAVGGRAALRRIPESRVAPFSSFDLPLWVLYLLVGGVVALAVAGALPAYGDVVRMVGANVLLGVRVLLSVQGFAVLAWRLGARGTSPLAGALLVILALVLDAQFFVMAVVGLIDVWANFRHLPRGGAAPVEDVR